MTSSPRRGGSILFQTFWLLVGSLIVVQAIGLATVFLLPPPRAEGVTLVQLVDRLRDPESPPRHASRTRPLPVVTRKAPPQPAPGLVSDDRLTSDLADRLSIATEDVRVFFRPDRGSALLRGRGVSDDGIIRWRGEPVFFDRTIVAARLGDNWRVIYTPPRPVIADWQKRMAMVFGIALVALLPLAWLFARRLVRPIRAFAAAADQVGRDASAPMVREDGPSELRVAARAVNAMQGRIAEQMREREAMVAAIAHDLRTPLSRIAFRIEGANDALREPIQRDIDQMKAMISATLSFVRGRSAEERREIVPLDEMLCGIVADERHVGRPVDWLDGAPPPGNVAVEPVAFGRMIQNLIDNAIAYGTRADIGLRVENGQARIVIADRGPGLDPADIEGMFAPFARKERSRNRETGGTGLGLAIARSIARDHGGDVRLSPRAGGGLEAIVILPLAGAHAT